MAQVAALPQQDTDSLKKMWHDLFGNSPPPYNKAFLVKRLSYRLQVWWPVGGNRSASDRPGQ